MFWRVLATVVKLNCLICQDSCCRLHYQQDEGHNRMSLQFIQLQTVTYWCKSFLQNVSSSALLYGACIQILQTFRSSRPEVFLGKGVLKICSRFTGEHPCRSAIFQSNFIEITLRQSCSPFHKNTSGWLLLSVAPAAAGLKYRISSLPPGYSAFILFLMRWLFHISLILSSSLCAYLKSKTSCITYHGFNSGQTDLHLASP